MSIIAKIKCFFGFCSDLEEIKKTEEKIMSSYKVEPGVIKVKEVSGAKSDNVLKVKEKRSWFNNGKEQKLVPVSEKLSNDWKKGKLKKVKGDK